MFSSIIRVLVNGGLTIAPIMPLCHGIPPAAEWLLPRTSAIRLAPGAWARLTTVLLYAFSYSLLYYPCSRQHECGQVLLYVA